MTGLRNEVRAPLQAPLHHHVLGPILETSQKGGQVLQAPPDSEFYANFL